MLGRACWYGLAALCGGAPGPKPGAGVGVGLRHRSEPGSRPGQCPQLGPRPGQCPQLGPRPSPSLGQELVTEPYHRLPLAPHVRLLPRVLYPMPGLTTARQNRWLEV